MNKYLVVAIITVAISMIFSIPLLTDQFVNAKTLKKIQFTQTLTSMQDPGQGHEGHQLALILSPNKGAIYDGSITYTASEPVQIIVLHEMNKDDAKGQPTWTVDGNTVFGLTLVDPGTNAGSYEFTGAALALHTKNTNKFTATVSVDGWIRGQTPELMEKKEETVFEPSLQLSRSSVSAEIPLHKAFFDEKSVYYIITDTNDKTFSKTISQKQKWKVEIALPLNKTPKESLNDVYIFLNGIEGKIELEKTNTIVNMPQIVWPGSQMSVRADKTLTDDTPFVGGQILEINTEKMTVTFIAHRGWGPDGRTIYYIVTDAAPSGLASLIGVTNAPTLAKTLTNSTAVDLYQFTNGIKGSGPIGFQAGIASAALGDDTYSPLCKISIITWKESVKPSVLETMADINSKKSTGDVIIDTTKPTDGDNILNCPFIDPFQ